MRYYEDELLTQTYLIKVYNIYIYIYFGLDMFNNLIE